MRFIEEIVVEEFLPTVRSMLAERLSERGLTQREVANVLGISQSAVSKYIHDDVTTNADIRSHPEVQETVEEIAAGLDTGDMSQVQALIELEILIRDLEAGGLLARLHEQRMPGLAGASRQIHDPASEVREREQTLAALRRGLRLLETTTGFAQLIPNVGVNLVAALPEATTVADVAAVPGRIFDVNGRTTVPAEPEFGASDHVATVLLAARAGGSDATAAINIQYSDAILQTLIDRGHTTVSFDPTAELEAAVKTAVESTPDATVLYQTGAVGIEPVVYILETDVDAVLTTVRNLCA